MDKQAGQIRVLEAAGGLVTNGYGECLMIFRYGRWDLPKGHLEKGESIDRCALREVEEETGLAELELGAPICDTRHRYMLDGRLVEKHTHWFRMRCEGRPGTVPQREEDISRACWISPADIQPYLDTTYPNIKEVFRKADIIV